MNNEIVACEFCKRVDVSQARTEHGPGHGSVITVRPPFQWAVRVQLKPTPDGRKLHIGCVCPNCAERTDAP